MATIESPIFQTIAPVTHDLGGFKVHRTLSEQAADDGRPLHLLRSDGPGELGPGRRIDVRPHPHINLATVTYLFAGAIDHRDSLGTVQRIEPGAVNLMTAGAASPIPSARRERSAPPGPSSTESRPGWPCRRPRRRSHPALRACRGRRLAAGLGRRRPVAADHGRGVRRGLARHPAFADNLCRRSSLLRAPPLPSTMRRTSGRFI